MVSGFTLETPVPPFFLMLAKTLDTFHYVKPTGHKSVGIKTKIKPGQPIGMALMSFLIPFPNSLIRTKKRFAKNGTPNFDEKRTLSVIHSKQV